MSPIVTKALEDVAERVCVGYVGPSSEYFCDDGIPFLRTGNVGKRILYLDDFKRVVPEFHIRQKKSTLKTGDVVVTRVVSDEINAAVIPASLDGGNCGNIIVIRPGSELDSSYLVHLLSSPMSQRILMMRQVGSAQSVINTGVLKTWQIPILAIEKQRRIAAILDQADALRAKRREALTQLDSLTQSIFIEMFGDPVPNVENWPTKTLKELGRVKTGGTPPSSKDGMFNGEIPFVTPGDLGRNEAAKRTVTSLGAAEAETVRGGSALVCCIGATIGKMAKARQFCAFNQQINAVEWGRAINDDFGICALGFFKLQIATQGASTTLPILKKSSFEKIEIPIPPLALQETFSVRIRAAEALKVAHLSSLTDLDTLFASLQHRAFRGEL